MTDTQRNAFNVKHTLKVIVNKIQMKREKRKEKRENIKLKIEKIEHKRDQYKIIIQ